MKHIQKRQWYFGVGIILMLSVVVLGLRWCLSSNSGQINETSKGHTLKIKEGVKDFDSDYVHLQYANNYFFKELPAKDDDLELYSISASTTYPKQIALSVSKLPEGNLENNSTYMLRHTKSDLYFERKVRTDTIEAIVWTRNDGKEQTALIAKNDRVAILAFTQQGGEPSKLTAEVDAVLRSFKWLK